MTWYEKIVGMSLDELVEFFGTSEIDDFLNESCKACPCWGADGNCSTTDIDRDCKAAIKTLLSAGVTEEQIKIDIEESGT